MHLTLYQQQVVDDLANDWASVGVEPKPPRGTLSAIVECYDVAPGCCANCGLLEDSHPREVGLCADLGGFKPVSPMRVYRVSPSGFMIDITNLAEARS